MVRYEDEKVIIEIEDSAPEEFVAALKIALICILQDRDMNEVTDMNDLKETNYMVLELLKNLEG
ncbi:MAG: hypothetical protein H7282_09305 [Cytophagaceae bacterium]|nr:hypothetical protein [Cytophagaceae bacterium]